MKTLANTRRQFAARITPSLMVGKILLPSCTHPTPAFTGTPCDADGHNLEPGTPPQDHSDSSQPNWFPFTSQVQFETADFLFKKAEMSQADTDILMRLWAATTSDDRTPFLNHQEMLTTIDAINLGDIPWQSFSAKYSGKTPPGNPPDWMLKEYTVYFRDSLSVVRSMISNPDFKGQFDYAPYREFEDGKRRWTDVMSGDWVWNQAVWFIFVFVMFTDSSNCQDIISEDPDTHGSMVVPLLLGSDKTLASNATGQNEFHPLYFSPGNVKNSVRRAHCNALVPIGFLAIPKSIVRSRS